MKIFSHLLIISVFIFLFVGFFHEINAITQDLGRHLINGQIVLETHNVPKTNFFSYTYPDFPFVNHHWLSEVIFYLLSQVFGLNGLLIFTSLLVLFAFGLIFFYSKTKNNLFPLIVGSILYLLILFERTDLRPEIFSFLFLSIFIFVLYKYRENFTRWIFILPLIELLWVNMHIYFPIGITVLGLFFIDAVILHIKNSKPFGHFNIRISNLFIVFLLSILVTLLNPNGIAGAIYPLKVFGNYGYTIEENQNIFFLWQYFQKSTILYFAITLFLLLISLIASLKKVRPIDWMLTIFFSMLAVTAVRNFPLFVFGTFIIFNRYFTSFYENLVIFLQKKFKKNILFQEKSLATSLLIICLIVIVGLFVKNSISQHPFGFGVEKGAKEAADFFLSHNIKGPIFNNFDVGSYLDYRFYKKEKVFVDGRPEAYPASFFQKVYIPMQENQKDFERIDNQYNFKTIFFSHTDQTPWGISFVKQIISNKQWELIYLDEYVMILVKNVPENKELIEKFVIDPHSINFDKYKTKDLKQLFFLANFFTNAGFINQQIKVHQKILEIDPNFCPSIYNLAAIFSRQQSPLSQIYINRFNSNCR